LHNIYASVRATTQLLHILEKRLRAQLQAFDHRQVGKHLVGQVTCPLIAALNR